MNSKVYFDYLDSLRFYAFFVVFIAHAGIIFPVSADWFYWLYRNVISHGAYGVNFFFVLSGFLITYLLLKEKRATKTVNVKNFYIKRMLRIWPVFFIVFLFSIFVLPSIVRLLGAEYVAGTGDTFVNLSMVTDHTVFWYFLFFLGNFAQALQIGAIPFALGVLWSVSVEEQFYLVWPLVARFLREKALLYISFIIIGASFIYKAVHINDANIAYYSTLSVGMDLAFGCALGIIFYLYESRIRSLHKRIKEKVRYLFGLAKGGREQGEGGGIIIATQRLIEASNNFQLILLGKIRRFTVDHKKDGPSLLILGICIVGLFAYCIEGFISTPGLLYDFARLMKRPTIDLLFVAILLFFLLKEPRQKAALSLDTVTLGDSSAGINQSLKQTKNASKGFWSGLSARLLNLRVRLAEISTTSYLGRISYGLYAYHAICMILVVSVFNFFGTTPNNITVMRFMIMFAVSFLLTIYVSHKSYAYIESRFLALKSKLK